MRRGLPTFLLFISLSGCLIALLTIIVWKDSDGLTHQQQQTHKAEPELRAPGDQPEPPGAP